ncbi:MAG: PAS domain-containing protein [Kiloniellales bacterium]|nr:PAS domain-containing protein [Kiloniellales bacterium]
MRKISSLYGLVAGAGTLCALPAAAQVAGAAAPAGSAEGAYLWATLLCLAGAALALAAWLCVRAQRRVTMLEGALNAVPQPRQIVDRDGRVILANPACQTEFGSAERGLAELLGEETKDIAESHEAVLRLAAKARGGAADHAQIRVRRRAGAAPEAWRSVTVYPLKGRPGCVLWLVDDITAERQMETILQEEQARFVDLLEHAPIGFYSVDAEGQFLFVNQTLADWLGLPPEELLGGERRLHDVVRSAAAPEAAAYDPFAGGEDPLRGEVTLCGADGLAFTALISQDVVRAEDGQVLRTRSVVRNLSRERAVEEALAHSVQRFKRFFEEAPIGIALLEPDGRIAETNASFRGLLELPQDGIEGKPLVDLVAEDERDSVAKTIAAAGGNPSGDPTIEVRFQGGPEVVCALYVNRLEGADGKPAGYITHFIDMTEQKKLEDQVSQSQKMQAVGQLAGGMAHDFNNLLTAMIGFSDLLLLRHRPGDQSFADIMQIKQNANRAANLVRQLLAFSRQQTLQPKVLNLTDVLAELTHLLRRLIGENIDLKVIHGRDIGPVKVDQGQLEQVIINLAVNARDAMPEGGVLTIQTSDVQLQRSAKRGRETIPPGHYALVEVRDTGCGIPGENMDRIFEPFFTTKEIGAGTGLGLSTVYGIVMQTGGFMAVESVIGEGTTFAIYLPHHELEKTEAVPDDEAEARRRVDTTGRGTVLLVEDEEAVRAFSARVLRNKGYNVLEARSGEVALEVMRDHGDPIDLLITDVVMPQLDGPGLVREVRAERPELKVIYISGYTERNLSQSLDLEGPTHFLAKPFTLKQFAEKVKEVLHEGAA